MVDRSPSSSQFRRLPVLELDEEQMQEPIPLGPEGELRHGYLENGIRYYVRRCPKPPQRAALALVVRVGSVVEQEQERGVAHIVEHLAFNGTETYTRHDVIRLLESIGAEFGACSNAVTSCDSTVYELEVPTDDNGAILKQSLAVLGEFAFKIRCDASDLARERGPVLEEWRSSRTSAGRAAESHWKLLLEGSRYADRLPIGLESVIRGVPAEVVREFYHTWYRPENIGIVVVGDFADCDSVVGVLRDQLGPLAPRVPGPAKSIPEYGFPQHSQPRCAVFADSETQQAVIHVAYKHPASSLATASDFRSYLVMQLLLECINSRLFKVSRRSDPPFFMAEMGDEKVCGAMQLYAASAHVSEDKGQAVRALEALLTELARVRLHGLSDRELAIARAKLMADAEAVFLEKDQAYCTDVRDEYVRHFVEGEFVTSPTHEVQLYKTLLPGVEPGDLQAAAAERLSPSSGCVVKLVAHKRLCTEDQLHAVLREVARAEEKGEVQPWEEEGDAPTEILAVLPPPGKVVSRKEVPQLGAVEMTLSNGMRVCLKSTPFLDDQLLVTGFAAGGLAEVPEEHFRSACLATTLAGELGIFGHKPHLLPDLVAGKRVEMKISTGAYWRSFGGEQSPLDLESALQLVYNLFFTSVQPVDQELATCIKIAREATLSHLRNPLQLFADRVRAINYGTRHHYFVPPSMSDINRLSPSDACSFFNASFCDPAHFTLCLTGNVSEQDLIPLLEAYAAAVPRPEERTPPLNPATLTQLPIDFPKGVVCEDVSVRMVMPQASMQISFPVSIDLERGREEVTWLSLAARMLETKLLQVLRFEAGEVYTLSVSPFFGLAGPASTGVIQGEVSISFSCDPHSASLLRDSALQVLELLQEQGPSQEEVDTLLTLERRAFESQQHENTYWHEMIVGGYQSKTYQAEGGDLDRVYELRMSAREAVMAEADPEAIRNALRRLLPYPARSRYTAVTLVPKPGVVQQLRVTFTGPWSPGTWLLAAAVVGTASYIAARWWRR